MVLRDVDVPKARVGLLKCLIEAYPGVAAVHAVRGAAHSDVVRLLLSSTRELGGELDGLLTDLTHEIEGLSWKVSEHEMVGDGG
jgi:hypothetical protein